MKISHGGLVADIPVVVYAHATGTGGAGLRVVEVSVCIVAGITMPTDPDAPAVLNANW